MQRALALCEDLGIETILPAKVVIDRCQIGSGPPADFANGRLAIPPGGKNNRPRRQQLLTGGGRRFLGATHVLASFDGAVAYYHRPGGAAWADHLQPLHVFPDTYRARFVRPEGGPLSLARGSASDQGTWLHHAVSGDLADAVAWADAKVVPVAAPAAGFLAPSAIYVESATYQRTPVGALGVALCGQYALADHQIFHVTSE